MQTIMRERQTLAKGGASAIDRTLLARWVSQIYEDIRSVAPDCVEVTRFVNSLQFAVDGRLFATLRVDTSGLFLREWAETSEASDFIGLNMIEARTLSHRLLECRSAVR